MQAARVVMSTKQSEPSKLFQYSKASVSSKTKKRKSKLMKQQRSYNDLQKESKLFCSRLRSRLHSETDQSFMPEDKRTKKMAAKHSKISKQEIYFAHGVRDDFHESTPTPPFRKEKLFANAPYHLSSNPPYVPTDGSRNDVYLPSSYHVLYHYHHHHHHGFEKPPEHGFHRFSNNSHNGKITKAY